MFDGIGNNFQGCETLSLTEVDDGANYKVPSARVQLMGYFRQLITVRNVGCLLIVATLLRRQISPA
ncbi:hypothetical protein TX23_12170 [Pseudomonas paralactis]|uniref:Uncharacterized protein n=1 Tax=Pseudomonas paralactis TaxID=1615673 RepID=A0A0R3AJC7_9PSED|nr:hypothetical protein TX23_12170 [Pseudomonas paralactis]